LLPNFLWQCNDRHRPGFVQLPDKVLLRLVNKPMQGLSGCCGFWWEQLLFFLFFLIRDNTVRLASVYRLFPFSFFSLNARAKIRFFGGEVVFLPERLI